LALFDSKPAGMEINAYSAGALKSLAILAVATSCDYRKKSGSIRLAM
jgi:hypothetical protein